MRHNIGKKNIVLFNYFGVLFCVLTTPKHLVMFLMLLTIGTTYGQIGYYDAPYTRYEADQGTLVNASATTRSFNQSLLQSEASGQICVNMSNTGSVSWTVSAAGDGLVVRYSMPDGQSGTLGVYVNNVLVGTMNLTTYYSWEYLSSNGNPNNVGVTNTNPKMRFDEVRLKLPSQIPAGGTLKLVAQSANISIDFAELEAIPASVSSSPGDVVYNGNGSDLQNVINLNGGATIYLPPGVYNVNNELYFGVSNTVLKGAGMWYSQIHFTNGSTNQGGLRANAWNISYSGLYLTTVRNSRTNSYKAINGVYTSGSLIQNVWAEHFECGAWIGQYNTGGPAIADGFRMSYCRFRDNYADGTNLCKGTSNAIVEHCNFRNNGDDDMAIWSANGQECQNNTFRYCTSENTWRASGCAIYGGLSNQAYNLLIQDNVEVGLRVNNAFGGAPFNGGGMHVLSNITILRCGTNQDLYNQPVGAIDLGSLNWGAGTRVQNVKFSCINIIDSKNDAIYINKADPSSDGFYNLVFENIMINGTGKEYPDNGGTGTLRGYGLLFNAYPNGYGTYCNITYANRGGNAPANVGTSQQGSFSWSVAGSCPTGCVLLPLDASFISFTGYRSGKSVKLDWATGSEKSNQKFIIERKDDQDQWQAIGEVKGQGNSDSKVQYQYKDQNPTASKIYYRLNQVDTEGASTYSNIVGINAENDLAISTIPNPFEDALTIGLNETGPYTIQIQDLTGKVVYQDTKENTIGSLTLSPTMPTGAYLLTVQNESSIVQQKIIKK